MAVSRIGLLSLSGRKAEYRRLIGRSTDTIDQAALPAAPALRNIGRKNARVGCQCLSHRLER
jgi:hypothetical protein